MVLLSPTVQHCQVQCFKSVTVLMTLSTKATSLIPLALFVHMVQKYLLSWMIRCYKTPSPDTPLFLKSLNVWSTLWIWHLSSLHLHSACMDKCTSGVEGCTHMQPLHRVSLPNTSSLIFILCLHYLTLFFFPQIKQKAGSSHLEIMYFLKILQVLKSHTLG